MTPVPTGVQELLSVQCLVITAAQLRNAAVPRHHVRWLVSSGMWQRTARGLYYAASDEPPWISRAWTASLAAGDGSIIAGTSAARLHGLLPDDAAVIQVLVPADQHRATGYAGAVVTRSRLRRRSQTIDGLRCTTVPETIIDCAGVLDVKDLEALIGRAYQRRLCNKQALASALAGRRFVDQRTMLHAAAEDAAGGIHSPLELRYARHVERPHGLPQAGRQVRIGEELEWADVQYDEFSVIVELDGTAFHENARFRDRRRDNRNSRSGHIVLRYGWAEVIDDPCGVAREVAAVLHSRGWNLSAFRSCGDLCAG